MTTRTSHTGVNHLKKTHVFGALVLSAVSLFAHADQKTMRMGIEAAYPPFNYADQQGKLGGFDYDIGNALCEEMKVKCQWVVLAFDGMIPSLNTKKIDAAVTSMSITPDRLKSVDFSKKYYHTPGRYTMKAGTELSDSLVELKGKKVGVQRASTYDRFATAELEKTGIEVVRYDTQAQAFLDLQNGRIDAALADSVFTNDSFLQTPQGKGFAMVGPSTASKPEYFGKGAGIAIRKGDVQTKERLDAAIDAIRANGTYDKVMAKYFTFDIYGAR
ncbi:ABC transporter substrate-binding protein [Pseudomonas sp. Irchel 3E20]|uniref:ABC transporter substrate-binding protein n=1 Tax=Pseudomonas sp. Irchel 3E20 TaxID=2008983 RepID=UPI00353148FC